jgi:hypothetical protein
VSEVQAYGTTMIRIDVPALPATKAKRFTYPSLGSYERIEVEVDVPAVPATFHLHGGGALYGVHPASEAEVLAVLVRAQMNSAPDPEVPSARQLRAAEGNDDADTTDAEFDEGTE